MPERKLSQESATNDDKERKRRKQLKKMRKILAHAWQLDGAELAFQHSTNNNNSNNSDVICDLQAVGQKLEGNEYTIGKSGWQDFAKDIGGVYNLHINNSRKTKLGKLALQHLKEIQTMLGQISPGLEKLAASHAPDVGSAPSVNRKRKTSLDNGNTDNNNKDDNNDVNQSSAQEASQKASSSSAAAKNGTNKQLKRRTNTNAQLAEREERALESLHEKITERCGNDSQKTEELLSGFTVRVTKRTDNNGFRIIYYNSQGRRFKSLLEVARHLNLEDETIANKAASTKKRRGNSNVGNNVNTDNPKLNEEKKKIRRNLERLRKQLARLNKNLEDHPSHTTIDEEDGTDQGVFDNIDDNENCISNNGKDSNDGIDGNHKTDSSTNDSNLNEVSMTDNGYTDSGIVGMNAESFRIYCDSAAAVSYDFAGFPGIPDYCTPDVIQVWDFLCTFSRAISWTPAALDDFASALAYQPPQDTEGDDVNAPPVMIAEAHIALLKLLYSDRTSDDWWWSTLETDDLVESTTKRDISRANTPDAIKSIDKSGAASNGNMEQVTACLRLDMSAMLDEHEELVITNSWIRILEDVGLSTDKEKLIKAINDAKRIATNKWVLAYLRKVRRGWSSQGIGWVRHSIMWLVKFVKEARIAGLSKHDAEDSSKSMKELIDHYDKQIAMLPATAPSVTESDVASDVEYEDDSDDDEEIDDDVVMNNASEQNDTDLASHIPERPLPTLTDMLLPPSRPTHNAEYLNSFTWTHMTGATCMRILHRKKRELNEIDDKIRAVRKLSPLTVRERKQREAVTPFRILTECVRTASDDVCPLDSAISHLCRGGNYLDLSVVEKLCLLRILVEGSYDTERVYTVIDGNYKQRVNAMKSLDQEQRKAKKDAKEKATEDEVLAREKLVQKARDAFFDEKREEIRQLNERTREIDDEVIESFTDEDILEFDEDIKADYEALPGPDSFTKLQVSAMVRQMHEEAAFDTDSLRILTLDDIQRREKRVLEEMEGQYQGFGGDNALDDTSNIERETIRSIERLRKDIDRAVQDEQKLPELRERAMIQLKDAIEDGTIKVLRSAIAAAKKAKLTGADEETGGVWTVSIMRDAALELESAKQNKKLVDAQKDLIAKRNKCFLRSDPVGSDRYDTRFWALDYDKEGQVWAEAEYIVAKCKPNSGSVTNDMVVTALKDEIETLNIDVEADLDTNEDARSHTFRQKEYHSTALFAAPVYNRWGCHASEDTIRKVTRKLDNRIKMERDLKAYLKESMEQNLGAASDVAPEGGLDVSEKVLNSADLTDSEQVVGDETHFEYVKETYIRGTNNSSELDQWSTAINRQVRLRIATDPSKESSPARYENGVIKSWKMTVAEVTNEGEDQETESQPMWKALSDRGSTVWLDGKSLHDCLSRFISWSEGKGRFEPDSVVMAYRNSLGRFCGKAADAPFSCSPIHFTRLMVKRESELYSKLKNRSHDNNWGGQNGARAMWTTSMKDYAFDFPSARQGLLTLENAIFELTGQFSAYVDDSVLKENEEPDAIQLLTDPDKRVDIELESIEKSVPGLWNSPASRAVFIEIVTKCETTGFLALALDLLCRNTARYLQLHKATVTTNTRKKVTSYSPKPVRATRRKNAWQQANDESSSESEFDDNKDSDGDWD